MKFCSPHPKIKTKSFIPQTLGILSHAVVSFHKIWNKKCLYVHFLDGNRSQHEIVMAAMFKWSSVCGIKFGFVDDADVADIRVSFKYAGAWSTVGSDARFVSDKSQPTMNFGFLDMPTALHEVGHALGFNHEHQNPDGGLKWNRGKVIKSLSGPPNNWDLPKINHNVLNRLDESKVRFSLFDSKSIMLYFFPDDWTLDGKGTKQNETLSATDIDWARKFYPNKNVVDNKKKDVVKVERRRSTNYVLLVIVWIVVAVIWFADGLKGTI